MWERREAAACVGRGQGDMQGVIEKGKEESYYTLQWEISPRVKFHLVRINAVFFFNWQLSLLPRLSVGLGTRLLAGQIIVNLL